MLDKIKKLIQEHKPIRITLYGDSICEVGRSPTYFGGASCAAQNWGYSEETLAAVKRVALEFQCVLADVRSAILKATASGRDWDKFHAGNLDCHPNDQGHAVWAQATFDAIQQDLTTTLPPAGR